MDREIRERVENSKLIFLCDVDSLNLGVSGSPAKINDILTVSMSGRDEEISLLSRGDCDCSAIPNGEEARTGWWLTTKHRRRRWLGAGLGLGGSETEQSRDNFTFYDGPERRVRVRDNSRLGDTRQTSIKENSSLHSLHSSRIGSPPQNRKLE